MEIGILHHPEHFIVGVIDNIVLDPVGELDLFLRSPPHLIIDIGLYAAANDVCRG